MIKTTGSNILGNMTVNGQSLSRIDYGIIKEAQKTAKDPYENLPLSTMIQTTANAQFEGICTNYPVVDTRAFNYRIHG